MIRVRSAGVTDKGRKRKGNEDALFVDDELGFYVVSDGMGGRQAGEVASRMVVKTMSEAMQRLKRGEPSEPSAEPDGELSAEAAQLLECVQQANQVVHRMAQEKDDFKGMGATLASVLLTPSMLIACNVGDSPIYLIRNAEINALFVPHTVIAEHAALAPAGAKQLGEQYRHMITRAVGIAPTVEPDLFEKQLIEDDLLVLCSDGLSDKLTMGEIKALVSAADPEKACHALVNLANERGGDDNITVIVLRIIKVGADTTAGTPAISGRSMPRSPALRQIAVEYDTDEASYQALVDTISPADVFIETTEPFSVGQALTLTISDTRDRDSFMVSGRVAERRPDGILVKFDALTPDQEAMIEYFAEHYGISQ